MQISAESKPRAGYSKKVPKHRVRDKRGRWCTMNYKIKTSHQWKVLCRKHVDWLLSEKGHADVWALSHDVQYTTPGRTGNYAPDEIAIPTALYNNFKNEIVDTMVVDLIAEGTHAKVLTMTEFETMIQEPGALGCRKIHFQNTEAAVELAQDFGVIQA